MSTGGKYILETNLRGGVQESILFNLNLLNQRLKTACDPVLVDISDTHANFVKSYHKPVLPMAYEFRADQSESGGVVLGATNTFSLPLYGDFMCELVFRVRISGLRAVNPIDKCGFVDYIGHRLMERVQMDFAGNIVDEYTYDAYNVYYNYFLPEKKKLS